MVNIMKIQLNNQKKQWETCPEMEMATAQIVDITDTFEVEYQGVKKEAFRYILEVEKKNSKGYRFTVATKPFTLSLHEKSNLRKFTEAAIGRKLRDEDVQLDNGWDPTDIVGCYVKINVVHNTVGEKVYANIEYYKANPTPEKWETSYVRLEDR